MGARTTVGLENHGPLGKPGSFAVEHYDENVQVQIHADDGGIRVDLAIPADEVRSIAAALLHHATELEQGR